MVDDGDDGGADQGDGFGALVAKHLDGALDAQAEREFAARLRGDAQARRALLAAAAQATALPRLALESGLARAAPPGAPAPPGRARRWYRWAAAALLAAAVAGWWASHGAGHGVRIAARPDLVIVRSGVRSPSPSWAQVGDRLEAGAAGARLEWDDGTAVELAAGARLAVERLGQRTRLGLEHGDLTADVAPQGPDGSLTVATPFGAVEVLGTRFRVQVDGRSGTVAVERGSVRVVGDGHPAATVRAGFALGVTDGRWSQPGPAAALPAVGGAAASAPDTVRLGAATFHAEDGWEGDLVDGAIRGRPVGGSPVTRVTTPLARPAGFARLSDRLRCTLDLGVDQPTTLAVLLVCDDPDGGSRWIANVQCERRIAAGAQRVALAGADFHIVEGGARPPQGSRIVAVAVMSWQPAADLRVRWIELGQEDPAATPAAGR